MSIIDIDAETIAKAQRRAFLIPDEIQPAVIDPASVAKMDHRLAHQFGSALTMAAADIKPHIKQLKNAFGSLAAISSHKDCPPDVKNFVDGISKLWDENLDFDGLDDLVTALERKARELIGLSRSQMQQNTI